jgi:hypothetical protein
MESLYSTWTDAALVRVLTDDRADYRVDAVAVMERELRRRSLALADPPAPDPERSEQWEKGAAISSREGSVGFLHGFRPRAMTEASPGSLVLRGWAGIGLAQVLTVLLAMWFLGLCLPKSPARNLVLLAMIPDVAASFYMTILILVGTWRGVMRIRRRLFAIPLLVFLLFVQTWFVLGIVGAGTGLIICYLGMR